MGRTFGKTITQPAKSLHSATVIVLHGLGDDCHGWEHLGKQLAIDHVKWVYPTGAARPITVNGGQVMPAWFDLRVLGKSDKYCTTGGTVARRFEEGGDHDGINESVEYVKGLIDQELAAGIDLARIVVLGFSQGGHIALKTALNVDGALGGCIALSTMLPSVKAGVGEANKSTPIFIGHGDVDPLLPIHHGEEIASILRSNGFEKVDFRSYGGVGHSSCPEELQDVKNFLLCTVPVLSRPKPTMEEISTMSVRELKKFLTQEGVDLSTCIEKSDLIEAAKSLL